MKNVLTLATLIACAYTGTAQTWTYPSSGTAYFDGNVGIGTQTPQAKLEVIGNGQFIRNPATTGYTTFRLYNDQNNMFRTLEIDYSGSSYSGQLVNSGPQGESGSITTTGPYPLTLGTNNTRRLTVSSSGKIGINTNDPLFNLDVNGNFRTTSFINAAEYITIQNGSTYRIAMNGQSDAYFVGRDAAANDKFVIHANGHSYFNGGNVGIGKIDPYYKLDVVGNLRTSQQISAGQYITVDKAGSYRVALNGQGDGYIVGRNDLVVDKFLINSNGVSYFNGGNVGIGVTNPDYKLTVDGNVKCEEVKVEIIPGTGPDYVFEPTYNLTPLDSVSAYIREHKHLPEVPSAKQMEEEGMNLKEMNLLLLKKVEELTLHLIEQKNAIEQQEKVSAEIIKENTELRSRISSLEKSSKK